MIHGPEPDADRSGGCKSSESQHTSSVQNGREETLSAMKIGREWHPSRLGSWRHFQRRTCDKTERALPTTGCPSPIFYTLAAHSPLKANEHSTKCCLEPPPPVRKENYRQASHLSVKKRIKNGASALFSKGPCAYCNNTPQETHLWHTTQVASRCIHFRCGSTCSWKHSDISAVSQPSR